MGPLGTVVFASGSEQVTVSLAIIIALGVGGQWIAKWLRIPSVLLLLTSGILVGPVFDFIDPEVDFGEVLFPIVSLAVGLLLYEGGLSLRLDRLIEGRSVILRLVTVGALVTWLIGWGMTALLFDVSTVHASLIGAILVVSGPTVVIPLVRLARPREPSGSILRWEGIIIDPVGATLAIVVLDVSLNQSSASGAAIDVGVTLLAGAVAGLVVAGLALFALHRHLIPDHLHNPAMLAAAIIAFAAANEIRPEAGLMATTMLGIALANQRLVPARELTAFSEDVGYVILGTLFITLGAMVDLSDLVDVLPRAIIIIAVLVFVARPIAVWLSTVGSGLRRPDRQFLAWMAPRGIVAASVATVFSRTIEDETGEAVAELVPVVFATVIITVALYGLTAIPVARATRVAKAPATGLAIVSNHRWAVDLADALAQNFVPVLLVSSSHEVQRLAMRRGVLAYDKPIDSEDLDLALDGVGVGRALILTDDENLASHAAEHLAEHIGRANLYQIPPDEDDIDFEMRGRAAFRHLTFGKLTELARRGEFVVGETVDLERADMPLLLVSDDLTVQLLNEATDPPTGGQVIALRSTD